MFTTSLDLLYGVIALCLIIFTGFLAWIMFYMVQILKQGNQVISDIRQQLSDLQQLLESVRDRVVNSTNSISMIAKHIGGIVQFIQRRKRSDDEEDDDF